MAVLVRGGGSGACLLDSAGKVVASDDAFSDPLENPNAIYISVNVEYTQRGSWQNPGTLNPIFFDEVAGWAGKKVAKLLPKNLGVVKEARFIKPKNKFDFYGAVFLVLVPKPGVTVGQLMDGSNNAYRALMKGRFGPPVVVQDFRVMKHGLMRGASPEIYQSPVRTISSNLTPAAKPNPV